MGFDRIIDCSVPSEFAHAYASGRVPRESLLGDLRKNSLAIFFDRLGGMVYALSFRDALRSLIAITSVDNPIL